MSREPWSVLDNGNHLAGNQLLRNVEVLHGKAVFHFGDGMKIEVNSFPARETGSRVEVVVYPAVPNPVLTAQPEPAHEGREVSSVEAAETRRPVDDADGRPDKTGNPGYDNMSIW